MWASSNQRWAFVFEPKPECQYSVSSGLVKSESTWLLDTPRLPGGTDYLFPPAASLKKITTGGLRMRNLEALKAKRKEMLANPTEAEAIFHERIKQLGERFHPQHIIGFYIVDFVFPKKMLIVEIDGKHHRKGEPYKHDMRRTEFLKSLGFEVSRIPNKLARTRKIKWIRTMQSKPDDAFSKAIERAESLAVCVKPEVNNQTVQTVKAVRLIKSRRGPQSGNEGGEA
jgi:very-short-patch-repair endonuclease